MMCRYIGALSLLAVVMAVMPVTVKAGGTTETPPPAESSAEETQSAVDGMDRGEHRAMQKELLRSIGIRVIEERVFAVNFEAGSLDGETVNLDDHLGSFVFLNFWATWCPPCREEMPAMERMQAEFSDLPFQILAVSVQEDTATVQHFIDEYGYTYPILLDPMGRTASHYGVRGLPTTYFIDRDGVVLGLLIGIRDWGDESILATLREAILLGSE
jgi:peroxiredoxin